MKSLKYFLSIWSIISIELIHWLGATHAATLKPSLYKQMQQQNIIDAKYLKDKASVEVNIKNSLYSLPSLSSNTISIKNKTAEIPAELSSAPEVTLDPIRRAEALSRPVVRNITSPNSQAVTAEKKIISSNKKNINNVDIRRLESAWLEWNNSLRTSLTLPAYDARDELSATAQEWSEFSKDRGYITHARPWDGCTGTTNYVCYNFRAVDAWFTERGINPEVINRSKHTENIGLGKFKCSQTDCTDEAIKAMRKTYDFFLSEKSYNWVHYRSLTNPNFKHIGIGFAYSWDTYYLTVHYANDF